MLRCTPVSFLLLTVTVPAQNVREINDNSMCKACQLTLTRVARLGNPSDPELLVDHISVVHLHDAFFASGTIPRDKVLVFDRNGHYQQAWGRQGSGPGEFRSILRLAELNRDSLVIFDHDLGRASIFTIAGKFMRSFPVPTRFIDVDGAPGDAWVISAAIPAAGRVGLPLHLISPSGDRVRSFGADGPVFQSRPSASQRVIGRTGNGVWSARPDRYELEFWTFEGARTAILDRKAPWFPDREIEGAVNSARERPHPWLTDVFSDSSELVWTLCRVADQNWRPATESGRMTARDKFYDTIVEVIDPVSGQLLGSQRLPGYAHFFTNDGLVVTHQEGEEGIMLIDVWRPSLKRLRREQP
ncbi:MAG: 6-bladed beta-propeller [Gemmatimonadota bacterium]